MQNIVLITFFTFVFFTNFNTGSYLSAEEQALIPAYQELLSQPRLLSEDEISENVKGAGLDMAFHCDATNYFRFVTHSDEIYFEVVFDGKLPDSCFEEDQALFIEREQFIGGKTRKQFIFSFRLTAQGEEVNIPIVEEEISTPDSNSYLVSERRIIEKADPQKITEKELLTILSKKKVLFYTGAGISIAAGVPAMAGLCSMLGIEEDENMLTSIIQAIAHPKNMAEQIKRFHDACFNSPPSNAHYALKELSLLKNCQIVTENLDYLHQRSGIMPYRVHARHLREEVDPSTLTKIDYLICIGLSYDDRGFIGWFKKHHPDGKIISIDLNTPSYLDSEDFLLQGDLQEIVPRLHEKLFLE